MEPSHGAPSAISSARWNDGGGNQTEQHAPAGETMRKMMCLPSEVGLLHEPVHHPAVGVVPAVDLRPHEEPPFAVLEQDTAEHPRSGGSGSGDSQGEAPPDHGTALLVKCREAEQDGRQHLDMH